MKIGYSLSLMEVVAAEEVAYGDCAKFQIVCPCCREAVFKKVRPAEIGRETHFLSHYRASAQEAAECELRVSALSDAFLAQWSKEGRNQTLQLFLSVLREKVVEGQDRLGVMNRDALRRDAERLLARPDFQPCVDGCEKMICMGVSAGDMWKQVESTLAEISVFESRSDFWKRRQATYVQDLFSHLLTGQAVSNVRFLAACAYVLAVRKPDIYRPVKGANVEGHRVYPVLRAMVDGKPQRVVSDVMRRCASGVARRAEGATTEPFGSPILDQSTSAIGGIRKSGLLAGALGTRADIFSQTFRLQGELEKAQAEMAEGMARRRAIGEKIVWLDATLLIVTPLIGLLAAVPFPDIAADRSTRLVA